MVVGDVDWVMGSLKMFLVILLIRYKVFCNWLDGVLFIDMEKIEGSKEVEIN